MCKEQKAFEIASQVYDIVFQILDSVEQLPGEVAGVIAQKIQNIIEEDLREEL